ncbi:MAG: pyrroline-5-carboxylate reductase [Armatimonadetes bacterium]|nr:pyrroline-5-carboxylate reductase [Armatimonadota bacterium]
MHSNSPQGTTPRRIAFIGAGFMGEALIRGVLAARLFQPAEVIAADASPARLALLGELGVVTTTDNVAAVRDVETIVLAVKPQVLPQVLAEVAPHVSPGQLLLSIAAGVSLAFLEGKLPAGVPVIRAMPNLLATVGAAATALAPGAHATEEHLAAAERIFGAVGSAVRGEEKLLNAVTGLSGSGPAYICLVIEALADAGVNAGLARDVALRLAAQTVMGTGQMILQTGRHPAQVKDQVSSPGGTTIAGVGALERAGLRAALFDAVAAAIARADDLERAAAQ